MELWARSDDVGFVPDIPTVRAPPLSAAST
jgi:hypothetical protein